MADNSRSLRFRRTFSTTPGEVYRAFTNATALRQWLCNTAQAVPVKGGRLYVAWNDGEYASGSYTALDPDKSVAFTWLGKAHPAETRVRVNLRADGEGTSFALTHSGFGKGKKWNAILADYERAWQISLENLQSMLEAGPDLRIVRRPLLGLSYGLDLTEQDRERLHLPSASGCRLESVTDGKGAHAAGLQKDDVIVRLGNRTVKGWADLIDALQAHRAGDQVPVVFYRSGEKRRTVITLSAREIPEVPPVPADLARELSKLYLEVDSELERALAGVDDTAASHRSSPDEWGVKEILAHLIDNERSMHFWLTCMVESQEPGGYGENLNIRLDAIVCAYPTVTELLREYKKNRSESVAFVDRFPDSFVKHKGTYWEVGYGVLDGASHTREHIGQIKAVLELARAAGEAPPAVPTDLP